MDGLIRPTADAGRRLDLPVFSNIAAIPQTGKSDPPDDSFSLE